MNDIRHETLETGCYFVSLKGLSSSLKDAGYRFMLPLNQYKDWTHIC